MSKIIKSIMAFAVAVIVLIAYQNCGRMQSITESEFSFASKDSCELAPMVFEQSYHSFLQTNCGSCHRDGGAGNGEFGDPDLLIAYNAFSLRGSELIDNKALNKSHQSGITGPHLQGNIDAIHFTWDANWETCLKASSGADDKISGSEIVSMNEKYMLANKDFKKLTWDLGTDSDNANFAGVSFSIEAKLVDTAGQASYEFTNPTISTTTDAVRVAGIDFYINGEKILTATTLKFINVAIATNQSLELVTTNTVVELAETKSSDTLSFVIREIKKIDDFDPANPPDVNNPYPSEPATFSELTGADGVFGRYCISCHKAGNALGGLDLTDYQSLIDNNYAVPNSTSMSSISRRMRDTTSPMPRSGILDEVDILRVESWINNGAKND